MPRVEVRAEFRAAARAGPRSASAAIPTAENPPTAPASDSSIRGPQLGSRLLADELRRAWRASSVDTFQPMDLLLGVLRYQSENSEPRTTRQPLACRTVEFLVDRRTARPSLREPINRAGDLT